EISPRRSQAARSVACAAWPSAAARRSASARAGSASRWCESQLRRTRVSSPEDRLRQLADGALALGVVGERAADGHLAGAPRRHAVAHEQTRVEEEPRADALLEPARLQVAHLLAQLGRLGRRLRRDSAPLREQCTL